MKPNHILSLLLMLGIATTSCENEITYADIDKEPSLIINALFNADADVNYVYLSMTNTYSIYGVDKAVVKMYVNDRMVEECLPIVDEWDYYYPPQQYPYPVKTGFEPGDKVRVEAHTTDGKYRAWAECVVPPRATIATIDTSTVTYVVDYSSYYKTAFHRFKIKMEDDPNEKNYYRLVMEVERKTLHTSEYGLPDSITVHYSYNYTHWEDVALTDGRPSRPSNEDFGLIEQAYNTYGIFNDSYMSNGEYTLVVDVEKSAYVDYWIGDYRPKRKEVTVRARVQSITADEYWYLKALNLYESDLYDDLFSEPIRFPSNVNGGLGFVGMASEAQAEVLVEVEEYRYEY